MLLFFGKKKVIWDGFAYYHTPLNITILVDPEGVILSGDYCMFKPL